MFFNFDSPQKIVVELVNGPDDGLKFTVDIDDTKLVKYHCDEEGNQTVAAVYLIQRRKDGKWVGIYVGKDGPNSTRPVKEHDV